MPSKKKPSSNPNQGQMASLMVTWLHQQVVAAVIEDIPNVWLCRREEAPRRKLSTHVMGTFKCTTANCSTRGWGSKKIAILIRGYSHNGYNAIVFKQRCRSCNELGSMKLDDQSCVERIEYRLKKWAGVHVEKPEYSGKKGLPHKVDLCEGCRRGICQQA